jgi:hypothetical protein
MNGVVLVHGTGRGTWAEPDRPFRALLHDAGLRVIEPPFEWSGDLSGIPSFTGTQKHSDWRAGGFALALYLRSLPYEDRNVIAHSHGGQCAAYAAARWGRLAPIRRLVTVSTPVRSDMEPVWTDAKPSVGFWLHVASKETDWTARFGQLFDGHIGWKSRQKQANVNAIIPKFGHSHGLMDPELVQGWKDFALLEYLTMPDERIRA